MMSVNDLIDLIVSIHKDCLDVVFTKKVIKATGEKLMTTKPLLEVLLVEEEEEGDEGEVEGGGHKEQQQEEENNSNGSNNSTTEKKKTRTKNSSSMVHMIEMLNQHLIQISRIVKEAKKMKPILYIIHAPYKIHEQLDLEMGHIQFTLTAYVTSAAQYPHDAKIRNQLETFLTSWQKKDDQVYNLREQEYEDKMNLIEGDVEANLMRFTTGNSSKERMSIVEALKAEEHELHQKLLELEEEEIIIAANATKGISIVSSARSTITTASSVTISRATNKLVQEEAYLQRVIAAMEQLVLTRPSTSQNSESLKDESASWVYCPISKEIMTDPVTVDCETTNCRQQAFNRPAIQDWFDNGNTNCPSCNNPLRSNTITASPQLQQAIEERICYTLPSGNGMGGGGGDNNNSSSSRQNDTPPIRCCGGCVLSIWKKCTTYSTTS